MKTLVVLSGGMDSTAAMALAKENGHEVIGAVHFQYGSKHNKQELAAVKAVTDHYEVPLKIVDLPFIKDLFKSDLLISGGEIPEGHYEDESMKKTVVPFRNGIMLSIAAGLAESMGAEMVTIGNHLGDHAIYPDCREAFIRPMFEAIERGTYARIKIWSPFLHKTKTEIAKEGAELDVPFKLTWSCYKGGKVHCGKCGTCVERKEAFAQSGVKDPTVYEVKP